MKCPVCNSTESWIYNSSAGGTVFCNSCGNNKAEYSIIDFVNELNRQSQKTKEDQSK